MAELFDFAVETGKVTQEQIVQARDARMTLKKFGIRKTMEEAAILCGALTKARYSELAKEWETAKGVKAPEPKVAVADPEVDAEYLAAWRGKGMRKEVEQAMKRQEDLRASGLAVPMWEIVKGMDEEEEQGPKLSDLEMAPAIARPEAVNLLDEPVEAVEVAPPAARPMATRTFAHSRPMAPAASPSVSFTSGEKLGLGFLLGIIGLLAVIIVILVLNR